MPARVAITFGELTPPGKKPPYFRALEAAGLEGVENPDTLVGLAGLMLPGGADIDPARYGQERRPQTGQSDCDRDAREFRLLGEALEADLPVLAICRGLQLFNVAHGGTLIQHLEGHVLPVTQEHAVELAPDSRLARLLGMNTSSVNSRHHQAADRVGAGLVVAARAPDGIIEAVERPDRRFALAVQWHPEDRVATCAADRAIFEAFARAAQS